MSESFETQLKEFSEKHGAVLLGMHRELQTMQKSIDQVDDQLEKAQSLNNDIDKKLQTQKKELKQFQDKLHEEQLAQLKSLTKITNSRLSQLDLQQAQAKELFEKGLSLIAENNQRETAFQLYVRRLINRVSLISLLIIVGVSVALWMR